MRATMMALFVTTSLLSSVASGATPAVPSAVLNPTAQGLSVDNKLDNDDNLNNDAQTLAGIESQPVISQSQSRVDADHNTIDKLTLQLKHDTTYRANSTIIKADRTDLSNANKQLKLDLKACQADAKASGQQVSGQLKNTMCK